MPDEVELGICVRSAGVAKRESETSREILKNRTAAVYVTVTYTAHFYFFMLYFRFSLSKNVATNPISNAFHFTPQPSTKTGRDWLV